MDVYIDATIKRAREGDFIFFDTNGIPTVNIVDTGAAAAHVVHSAAQLSLCSGIGMVFLTVDGDDGESVAIFENGEVICHLPGGFS